MNLKENVWMFFLQLQYSFHKLIASKSDVLDFLDMFLIPNLWVSWIILHLRFKTLFLKVSQLWSFTPPCHSWHLTNRLRKSEKVTALFHQEAYSLHLSWVLTASFFYISISFLLYYTLLYSYSLFPSCVCIFQIFSLFFLPFYLSTCIALRLTVGRSGTSHQWVGSVLCLTSDISKVLRSAGLSWRIDSEPQESQHNDS